MTKTQSVTPGRKFGQVVRGAADIFLRDGFVGASVDDIASAAQVSKATIYSYFPDKTLMFREAMRVELERLEGSFTLDIDPGLPPERAIPQIAARIAEWLANPHRISLCRVLLAETPRLAELADDLQASLTRMLRDPVRAHLDRWADAGLLAIEDTDAAARQLIGLSAANGPFWLLGKPEASGATIQANASEAAALFLRAFAPAQRHGLRRSAGRR
ncbi:TetR/AcrR family transcriptional regulator [Paracoccus benzoatiresistens]|uniref:TetR/AcrR family transcriptional regulator n=1 Tax=Paracoccus benzoatiresistens TaxID=2997341 RepID=A0ABT4IZX0_9RHOB|nr:TetR/AcrR family transcriptional regulator [Paracoccus sp. EF6]MCZ0960397.1 TetR/AcrR family transcriptional regulator [Paracoccus sp. EF6]